MEDDSTGEGKEFQSDNLTLKNAWHKQAPVNKQTCEWFSALSIQQPQFGSH